MSGRAFRKIASSCVAHLTVGHKHLEEAVAIDVHVKRVVGIDDAALAVELLRRDNSHTRTDREARGGLRVLRCLGATLVEVLIKQRFEIGSIAFKADGVHVGEIVRDDTHTLLLGVETCFCYV